MQCDENESDKVWVEIVNIKTTKVLVIKIENNILTGRTSLCMRECSKTRKIFVLEVSLFVCLRCTSVFL